MAEAIADRLAEAFAECLHKKVREEWGYESPGLLKQGAAISEGNGLSPKESSKQAGL